MRVYIGKRQSVPAKSNTLHFCQNGGNNCINPPLDCSNKDASSSLYVRVESVQL